MSSLKRQNLNPVWEVWFWNVFMQFKVYKKIRRQLFDQKQLYVNPWTSFFFIQTGILLLTRTHLMTRPTCTCLIRRLVFSNIIFKRAAEQTDWTTTGAFFATTEKGNVTCCVCCFRCRMMESRLLNLKVGKQNNFNSIQFQQPLHIKSVTFYQIWHYTGVLISDLHVVRLLRLSSWFDIWTLVRISIWKDIETPVYL